MLAPPAAGAGGRLAAVNVLQSYVVWKFSDKVELAKRFLVDLVAAGVEGFRASEFYNLPCFPKAVPDLAKKLGPSKTGAASKQPANRYLLLAEAERWSTNQGHPGYLTAAVDETIQRGVIPAMFARVARGEQTPEASVRAADAEMRRIYARWSK